MEALFTVASGYIVLIEVPFGCRSRCVRGFIMAHTGCHNTGFSGGLEATEEPTAKYQQLFFRSQYASSDGYHGIVVVQLCFQTTERQPSP